MVERVAGDRCGLICRTFAYVRVSTTGQTTENQIQEIETARDKVDRRRVVSETVSGSSASRGHQTPKRCRITALSLPANNMRR